MRSSSSRFSPATKFVATSLFAIAASMALGQNSASLRTHFEFSASAPATPKGAKELRLWIPAPSAGAYQRVTNLKIVAPYEAKWTVEPKFGNKMAYIAVPAGSPAFTATISCDVERWEARPLETGQPASMTASGEAFLTPNRLIPVGGKYATMAKGMAGDATTTLDKVHRIFAATVDNLQYDYKKESPKLGQGDVEFVCDYKKGNCSDIHSYLIAMARSEGVPCYLEYGFPISTVPVQAIVPASGSITGYHCWTWFYDDARGWLPLDASDSRRWRDANRNDIADSLFGNLVLERSAVAVSVGRDITLEPAQDAPPLNNFIYPYAELDGKSVPVAWSVNYKSIDLGGVAARPQGTIEQQLEQLRKLVIDQNAEIARLKSATEGKPLDPQKKGTVVTNGSNEKVTTYGFVRVDTMLDSQRPNPNSQTPMYIESPDTAAIGPDSRSFSMHPRLSRFGIRLADQSKSLPGWDITGNIEFDFQNGGSESRPTPRLRHGWVQFKRGPLAALFGQTWDVISPVSPSPNDDTLMWNTGNLGDRRPQIRLSYDDPKQPFGWAVALGLTGAVDSKDLDGNGVRDGEAAGKPHVQARAFLRDTKGTLGAWAYQAQEETRGLVGGEHTFDSSVFGLDLKYQLTKAIDFGAETWSGKNLSDIRGGIGQGVNTTLGDEIRSKGFWAELGYMLNSKQRLAIGFSQDDPRDSDVAANGRVKNKAVWIHHKQALTSQIDFIVNYIDWQTTYKGLRSGKDHRINVVLVYRF